MRRVVVTGMGAITPIGNDVETFWNGLKEKKLGFGPITYFDTTDYKAKLAARSRTSSRRTIWIRRRQEEWSVSHSLR